MKCPESALKPQTHVWTQFVLVVEANAGMQCQVDLVCQFLWREEHIPVHEIPFLLFVFFFFL